MKQITFTLLGLGVLVAPLVAQDTLTVHKKNGQKTIYQTNRIDSVSFKKNGQAKFDTLRVHNNMFPTITTLIKKTTDKHLFADVDSLSFKKADTLDYASPDGYEVLVNSAYTFPSSWYGKIEGFAMLDIGTDSWTLGEGLNLVARTVTETKDLMLYRNLPNNDLLTRQWKQMYAAVNVCNLGIKIANETSFTPNDPRALRSPELYFWRAFYYWNIVETWGEVHLTTEPFYIPNLKANQSPLPLLLPEANKSKVEQFYAQIFSDLDYAIAHLPQSTTVDGRITKPIAEAFLARMYLTQGKNQEAKDMAAKVIQNYNYSLLPKYADLWDMKNQKNTEVIWSFPFQFNDVYQETKNLYGYGYEDRSEGRGRNNAHTLFVGRYEFRTAADTFGFINKDSVSHWPLVKDVRNGNSFNRLVPTPYLLSLYDEKIDGRYTGSFQTVWRCNKAVTSSFAPKKFAKGDTALVVSKGPSSSSKYFTLDYSSLFLPDGRCKNLKNLYLSPGLIKHMDSTRFTDPVQGPSQLGTGNIQSFRQAFVIRLSEMYLIAAEAEMKLGNQAAAKEMINVVRRRAALRSDLQTAMEVSQDLTIDFILDERARELAGEYLRWFDLKRTGKLLEYTKLHNPDIGDNLSQTHLVRPVPQPQLDFMKSGNLTQHVGY